MTIRWRSWQVRMTPRHQRQRLHRAGRVTQQAKNAPERSSGLYPRQLSAQFAWEARPDHRSRDNGETRKMTLGLHTHEDCLKQLR